MPHCYGLDASMQILRRCSHSVGVLVQYAQVDSTREVTSSFHLLNKLKISKSIRLMQKVNIIIINTYRPRGFPTTMPLSPRTAARFSCCLPAIAHSRPAESYRRSHVAWRDIVCEPLDDHHSAQIEIQILSKYFSSNKKQNSFSRLTLRNTFPWNGSPCQFHPLLHRGCASVCRGTKTSSMCFELR